MKDINITFIPMNKSHLEQWTKWIELPHVKDVWFIEGYETADYIHQKIAGNGYDYPFIIYLNDTPIGYIQCSDINAYYMKCKTPKGIFKNEDEGTWGMDLFIGEKEYLNKGYGTEIIHKFIDKLFAEFSAKKILIDPAVDNKRAIRCYEKVGFEFEKIAFDGVTQCYVMKLLRKG